MRTYHSPTLGDVTFTEEQYRKLLRRFNPDKKLGKEYKQPCICPKGDCMYNCTDCKPFGGVTMCCLRHLDELTDHVGTPYETSIGVSGITVYGSLGLQDLTTIRNALLSMVKT